MAARTSATYKDTKDRESNNREKREILLVDLSPAKNSAEALKVLESFVKTSGIAGKGIQVDVNAGGVVLSPNVLLKIKHFLQGLDIHLNTVFTTVPQTQQAALDEGFFVKEQATVEINSQGFLTPQTLDTVDSFTESGFASKPELPRFGELLQVKPEEVFPEVPSNPLPSNSSTDATDVPAYEEESILRPEVEAPTLYIYQTLRSGQVLHHDGNIVIVGDAHAGSEITATGDILVWGELRGIAQAGANGNYKAEIRALKIEAIQLRIAEYIARKPDRVYYHKPLLSVGASSRLATPEVARVADGEIKVFQEMIGK